MRMNQAQRAAAAHGEGPCLVLAGPGSGKTRVIVSRIQYLIEECKVRPEEILVITFTKYAAGEMKQRLRQQIGTAAAGVTAGTFHGIYYGILKWAYRFGPQNILSEGEKYRVFRQIISQKRMEVFDEENFIQEIISDIGRLKNHRIPVQEFVPRHCDVKQFQEIYREYEQFRREEKKIDFDDMLILCYDLFKKRPEVLKLWQKKFRYILIDEFQDINRVQYDVIRMLAGEERNLFVVGDDDQSIYGFRGADVKLMFQFQKDFPEAGQILLGTNYRSTSNIVRNALRVIRHNSSRFPKEIQAEKGAGVPVHIQETEDTAQESDYVVSQIRARIKAGVPAEKIAVLFRLHTDAEPIAEKLLKEHIPFHMRERLPNLYEHFIAQDVTAYLRLASGNRKRSDFLRIANRPKRYIGRDSLGEESSVSFEELRDFYEDKEWIQERIDELEQELDLMSDMAPYAAIQYLRKRVGYEEFLQEYAQNMRIPVQELYDILSEIQELSRPFGTFEEWAAHIREYTESLQKAEEKAEKKKEEKEGVRLMTMHASKGLEFDTVFIIQANEGKIPSKKALKEEEIEEERRLFYVAMTRAQEVLRIVYVNKKNGKDVLPSRFVEECLGNVSGSVLPESSRRR